MMRILRKKILFFLCYFFNNYALEHKEIVVIIPSYNNSAWCERNLNSVVNQTYDNWRAVYIDDCSSDGTANAVSKYLVDHQTTGTIALICNEQRHGALYNLYHAIAQCADNTIIVTLDGDDWFAHEHVLERINQIYNDSTVWMTYGTYQIYPDATLGSWHAISHKIIEANAFRHNRWISSHLRTFYAGLFKRIALGDLMHDGAFFSVTWDMAFMFPMLEMAGKHSHHVSEILYVYNQSNPINDYKMRLPLVLATEKMIRSKHKYQPLETL